MSQHTTDAHVARLVEMGFDARAALAALHDAGTSFDGALALLVDNPAHGADQPLHPTASTPADAVLQYQVTVPESVGGYLDVAVSVAGKSWTTQKKIPAFEALRAEMVDAFTAELGGLPPFPQPGLYDYMTSGTPPALVESRRQAAADFLRTAAHLPVICEYEPLLRFLGVHEHVYQQTAGQAPAEQTQNPAGGGGYELQEIGDPWTNSPVKPSRPSHREPAAAAAEPMAELAPQAAGGGGSGVGAQDLLRVAVVGLGGLGSVLAGLLGRYTQQDGGGVVLTCIARGEHLSRMKTNGLSVKLPDGGDAFALQEGGAVRFIDGDNAADAGEQDFVMACAAADDLPGLGPVVLPLLGPATAVVTFHPGLPWWANGGEQLLWGRVGRAELIAAVPAECGWDCWRRAPGEVVGRTGGLILAGEPAEKAETLQALLLAARVSGSVEVAAAGAAALAAVWAPLVKEHVFGCVAALTRQQTVGELAAAPASLQLVHAAAAELLATAELELGRGGLGGSVAELVGETVQRHSWAQPRLLASLQRGGRLEAEQVLRSPLRLAKAAGLACPTLEMLSGLAEARATAAAVLDPLASTEQAERAAELAPVELFEGDAAAELATEHPAGQPPAAAVGGPVDTDEI